MLFLARKTLDHDRKKKCFLIFDWLGLIQSVVLRTRLIKLYFLYRSSSISRLANPPPSNILNGARLAGGEGGGGVKALYVLFQLETYTLTFEMSVLVQKLSILLT